MMRQNVQGDDPRVFITVITFNIWGLPDWIANDKTKRIDAIGNALNNLDADVVCLQEVWVERDFQNIKLRIENKFPHSHYFYSGVTGSGLCVFTKWPITDILFHQWPLNGYIHMIHHGDWFGGKGVGLVVLDINGFKVNVYTSHFHAQYHSNDSYLVHRIEQAFDTAMFIKLTSKGSDFSVLAGDLNTLPDSICLRLLLHVADLKDAHDFHDPNNGGGTFGCTRNSYSTASSLLENPDGERIDYVLYKPSSDISLNKVQYAFPLTEKIPDCNHSYSDHEAVRAHFELVSHKSDKFIEKDFSALKEDLKESIQLFTNALSETTNKSSFYWIVALAMLSSLLIPIAADLSLTQSKFYTIQLIITVLCAAFFVLMATIWCKLEFHGILGARDRMAVLLNQLNKKTDS